MKNPFVIGNLVLASVFLLISAAQFLGAPVRFNISTFIGLFVASGMLGIAWHDYARRPPYDTCKTKERCASHSMPVASATDAAWVHHTISA